MAPDAGDRLALAGRAAITRSRHAVVSAAAATTEGSARLVRLARNPPVTVRPAGLWPPRRSGTAPGFELRAQGLVINGLRIDKIHIRVRAMTFRRGSPIAVRPRGIVVRARLTEADVNWWLSHAHLPVRLRFTDEGIRARTGLGGVALGSMDVTVGLEAGLLRLSPQRVAVLGIGLSTAGFPTTPLPLPPLPRSARLIGLITGPGTAAITLELPGEWHNMGPAAVKEILSLAQTGRASVGSPARGRPTPTASATARPLADLNGRPTRTRP